MIRSSLIRVGSDFNARPCAPNSEKSAILRSDAVCFKGQINAFPKENFFNEVELKGPVI